MSEVVEMLNAGTDPAEVAAFIKGDFTAAKPGPVSMAAIGESMMTDDVSEHGDAMADLEGAYLRGEISQETYTQVFNAL